MKDGSKRTIIWEKNSEPPKNYIWIKDDGVAYEWNENTQEWVEASEFASTGNLATYKDIERLFPEYYYNKYKEEFENKYLIFEAVEDGQIGWKTSDVEWIRRIKYSKDLGATWTLLTPTIEGTNINVKKGDIILFKHAEDVEFIQGGSDPSFAEYADETRYCSFCSTCKFYASGVIDSLFIQYRTSYSDRYYSGHPQIYGYGCKYLFYKCSGLLQDDSHPKLKLPLRQDKQIYYATFSGCDNMETTPYFYEGEAKEPKTKISSNFKSKAFAYCFSNCVKLNKLTFNSFNATSTGSSDSYVFQGMFKNCKSLTTVINSEIKLLSRQVSGIFSNMFNGCNLLNVPIVIGDSVSGMKLSTYTLEKAFYNCNKLSNITCFVTLKNASNCLNEWVYGVSPTGTFIKKSSVDWPTGASGIPSGWTVEDYVEP